MEILPCFTLPFSLGSNNGLAFTTKVSQIAKALGIKGKLPCAHRPYSSGQVERINRTIEETLTKFQAKIGMGWMELLRTASLGSGASPAEKVDAF